MLIWSPWAQVMGIGVCLESTPTTTSRQRKVRTSPPVDMMHAVDSLIMSDFMPNDSRIFTPNGHMGILKELRSHLGSSMTHMQRRGSLLVMRQTPRLPWKHHLPDFSCAGLLYVRRRFTILDSKQSCCRAKHVCTRSFHARFLSPRREAELLSAVRKSLNCVAIHLPACLIIQWQR
jgi:hypothetical protein